MIIDNKSMNAYKSHIVRLLLIALLVLPATTSCYDYGPEVVRGTSDSNYINVTVTVSTSVSPTTRGPQGGENGDGREEGIETRETAVSGVTLLFFRQAVGINASEDAAESTKID